jgi:hypothetical protein
MGRTADALTYCLRALSALALVGEDFDTPADDFMLRQENECTCTRRSP